ncbi:HmuY family protein [Gynurincola endophyticus]|uniref:HmuY family protein n=1 Tax=Gynurincola endophyticus TaxID=2479004 RepID=UPI000F8F2C81|nr:HmuY family protein [Gynurincola endophyticus]
MKQINLSFSYSVSVFIRSILFTGLIGLISCEKENLPPDDTGDDQQTAVAYYKLQRVENLNAITDDNNPTVEKAEILFSLKYKKEQPSNYAKTVRWDISFSGLYNSFIGGNSKTDRSNTGYEGPGIGGVLIVEKAFEEVTDIPADNSFKTAKGVVGTDDAGAFGQGVGWYLYDFGGTIVGDGSYDKMHVAYAIGDSLKLKNNTLLKPRTIVVKTATGDYAKIKMISCYKDVFTPEKWFRNTPHMFFSFEYVIVPAGSKKFEIR